MSGFDYSKLSDKEKEAIRQEIAAEDRKKIDAGKKIKADYESLKDEQVKATFKSLQLISSNLENEKVDIFNQFGALVGMKKEVFNISEKQMELQQSHTFSTADNKMSIIIGQNVIDSWGDEVNVGIERVNTWIDTKIADPKAAGTIRVLLKPNAQGTLKANRILDLSKHANEIGDTDLIEAVDFIRDQYKPERTSTYVKAKYLDENDQWQWLALSMSAV